jgi:predicted DCC family thiol-disulfide oxidoreductase YuxK
MNSSALETRGPHLTNHRIGSPAICIFDADCGICQSSVRLAARLGARVDFIGFQAFDFATTHGDLTLERAQSEVVFLAPSGEIFGGAAAVAQILRTSRVAPLGAILDSRLVLPFARVVYSWVARNRNRLPQACGVGL